MRLDSSGRLLIGHSSARTNIAGINDPQIQLEGLSSDDAALSIIRNTDNAFGGNIILGKTRGGKRWLKYYCSKMVRYWKYKILLLLMVQTLIVKLQILKQKLMVHQAQMIPLADCHFTQLLMVQ